MKHLIKRLLDLVIAVLALLLLSPIMLLVAIAVRTILGSPVIFRQIRSGLDGRAFTIYKFRTMLDDRDVAGNVLSDERRLTPFGRFLRSASLDELPELFNVVKGEMSLVGPRPLLTEYLDRYTARQARRHEVRPGITGWAQVNGRNALSWEEKFELDVWYVDHWSVWLDIKIMFLTPWKVLGREGISSKGHSTAPTFTGSRETGSS